MSEIIESFEIHDIRFATSLDRSGSDAMNPSPDYSAAYVIVRTSDGREGHGFVFTIGRGTEVQSAAIRAVEPLVKGREVRSLFAEMGEFSRSLVYDSHLRWLGPDRGPVHMAIGAVINAVWDLYAKSEGKPLWKLLADLPVDDVLELVDFSYLTDVLTRDEARQILERARSGKASRETRLLEEGFPAYTTSAGWLGYDDQKIASLAQRAIDDGFTHLKLKVGNNLDDDIRRTNLVRSILGPEGLLSIDANQRWDVAEAIDAINALAKSDLYWVEEPTSPDDIAGHAKIARAVAPIRLATGEQVANRVMFKQLLAAGSMSFCQIDACRVAGVNENVAILLLAAKHGVPVCPHAGGVGLCEIVQHLAMFDFVAVSGQLEDRWIEYVDHLHEHFIDPVVIKNGRYIAPTAPGMSAQMKAASIVSNEFAG